VLIAEDYGLKGSTGIEAVEKVPKQIFEPDAEKNDLTECVRINDFIPGKGQGDPRKHCSHWSKGLFLQAH
jgi:hypothetical protein